MADNRVWILSGPENQIGQQKERIHFKIALFAVRSSFKNIYQLKGEILPISVAFLRSKRRMWLFEENGKDLQIRTQRSPGSLAGRN